MTWLFAQLWLLLLVSFIAGALVAWVIARVTLPHVNDLNLRDGRL